MTMIHLAWGLLVSLRPRQWLKNVTVLTALFLSGRLWQLDDLQTAFLAFVAFCAASSAMYVLNDVVDQQRDRLHPTKQKRPVASGAVPVWLALAAAGVLALVAITLSMSVDEVLLTMVSSYVGLQLAYTLLFKQVIIIDAMLIALGFIVRVYAGAFVIHEPISAWLLLAVAAGAWFLALGKRRSEITLLGHRTAAEHRTTLSHYPEVLLDSLTTMAATSTIVFFSLFAFLSDKQSLPQLADFLPSTLEAPKLMMLSIPLVLYGVARYLYLIYEKHEASSPENALLHDWPLLVDVAALIGLLYVLIYILPGGSLLA